MVQSLKVYIAQDRDMEHFSAEHIERQGHGRDRTGLLPDSPGEMVEDIQETLTNVNKLKYNSKKLKKTNLLTLLFL